MKQINNERAKELKPFLYKQVSFCGRMVRARQILPFPYQVLLTPAEVGGITIQHIWVNVPHLCSRLRKYHIISQTDKTLEKRRPLEFDNFCFLSGKAFVDRHFKLIKNKKRKFYYPYYGIYGANSLIFLQKDDYIKTITDKVVEEIAQSEGVPLQIAQQRFMSSESFNILNSLNRAIAGLGPDFFLNLYQKYLAKAA